MSKFRKSKTRAKSLQPNTGDKGGRYRIHKVVVYLPNILMVAEETASPYAFLAWQVYTPLSSGYTDSRSRAT